MTSTDPYTIIVIMTSTDPYTVIVIITSTDPYTVTVIMTRTDPYTVIVTTQVAAVTVTTSVSAMTRLENETREGFVITANNIMSITQCHNGIHNKINVKVSY